MRAWTCDVSKLKLLSVSRSGAGMTYSANGIGRSNSDPAATAGATGAANVGAGTAAITGAGAGGGPNNHASGSGTTNAAGGEAGAAAVASVCGGQAQDATRLSRAGMS